MTNWTSALNDMDDTLEISYEHIMYSLVLFSKNYQFESMMSFIFDPLFGLFQGYS